MSTSNPCLRSLQTPPRFGFRLFFLSLTLLAGICQAQAAPALQPRGLRTAKGNSLAAARDFADDKLTEVLKFYDHYIAYFDKGAVRTPKPPIGVKGGFLEFIKQYRGLVKYPGNPGCTRDELYADKGSDCYKEFSTEYIENNKQFSLSSVLTQKAKNDHPAPAPAPARTPTEIMLLSYKTAQNEYKANAKMFAEKLGGRASSVGCNDELSLPCLRYIGQLVPNDARTVAEPIGARDWNPGSGSGGVAGGISGMAWQTALFTGLADYLVERAGDELALWLIQTFYKDLCKKHPDWFPESCGLLVSVKDPAQELPEEVPGLLFSAAIRKDLERFPVVAVRAAYNARSSVIPLVIELSKQDLTKQRLVALLSNFAEKAKLQEACSNNPQDPLCVGIALGVALEYLKDAIKDSTFPGADLCNKVKEGIQKTLVEQALLKIFKSKDSIPPGLLALINLNPDGQTPWSCLDKAPWVGGENAAANSATSVLAILEQIHLAYQGIEKFRNGTDKSEQALQQLVLDNAGHATEMLVLAAKLDGREVLRSAEVTLRAGNLAQRAFLPFISALLRGNFGKEDWIKQLKNTVSLKKLTDACKDSPQRAICIMAVFGVSLKYVADDVLAKDAFPGNDVCTNLQKEVKNGDLKQELIALFGKEDSLPPGLRGLVTVPQDGNLTWSCLSAAPWVDGIDSSEGVPKAAVGLAAELHAMYRGFVEYDKVVSASEKAKALQTLLFANARHASRVVYLATIVDGRPELKATANGVLVAIASTDVIEALFSMFVQLRNGTPPVELLAGFADLSRKSELPKLLCQSQETRNDIACTLVATGTLVAEFGGVSKLLASDRWDEETACKVTRDIAESETLEASLGELFYDLPPTLKDLFAAKKIDCAAGDWHQEASVAKLRALLRTVFELESQINTWRKSGAPPARERVGQLMALLNGVLHAAADVLDQDENDKVIKAEKVLAVLGDMFNANYVEGVRGSLALLALYKDALPDSIRRYIPLIADLANAQDAKGVQNALRAAAAPLGSWKRKYSRVTLSVSAIVGGQGGLETALAKPFGVNLQDGLYGGPMAALGLELGGPVPHGSHRAAFSMSGFLSVIDVGQLALARTTNTGDLSGGGTMPNQQVEASIASNIDLLDVFAPGLYWKFGFKAIPLTFGFGPTFAPRLRKYSYTDANNIVRTPDALSMIRLNMFIGVDLNLFPIH